MNPIPMKMSSLMPGSFGLGGWLPLLLLLLAALSVSLAASASAAAAVATTAPANLAGNDSTGPAQSNADGPQQTKAQEDFPPLAAAKWRRQQQQPTNEQSSTRTNREIASHHLIKGRNAPNTAGEQEEAAAAAAAAAVDASATLKQQQQQPDDNSGSAAAASSYKNNSTGGSNNSSSSSSREVIELNAFQAARLGFFRHSLLTTVILTIAYSIVFIVGIIGNSFVVAIVCKSPRMRTVTNYFIANLALADILVLLFCLPATLIGNIFLPYVLGLFVCKTVSYLQGVAVSASINTMVAVTMDRFLAICFPMDWHMSRRAARWTIACIWLFSMSVSLPWAIFFTLVPYTHDTGAIVQICNDVWPDERWGSIYFVCANLILLYLLPATLIILCYLGIWIKIERRNIPGDRPKGLKIELIMQKSKLKVVKMMMVVVVIFLLSWLPLYLIAARYKLAKERSEWEEWLINLMLPLAQWLGASNSCINPILYTFFNRKYKRGFIDLLKLSFCCCGLNCCPGRRAIESRQLELQLKRQNQENANNGGHSNGAPSTHNTPTMAANHNQQQQQQLYNRRTGRRLSGDQQQQPQTTNGGSRSTLDSSGSRSRQDNFVLPNCGRKLDQNGAQRHQWGSKLARHRNGSGGGGGSVASATNRELANGRAGSGSAGDGSGSGGCGGVSRTAAHEQGRRASAMISAKQAAGLCSAGPSALVAAAAAAAMDEPGDEFSGATASGQRAATTEMALISELRNDAAAAALAAVPGCIGAQTTDGRRRLHNKSSVELKGATNELVAGQLRPRVASKPAKASKLKFVSGRRQQRRRPLQAVETNGGGGNENDDDDDDGQQRSSTAACERWRDSPSKQRHLGGRKDGGEEKATRSVATATATTTTATTTTRKKKKRALLFRHKTSSVRPNLANSSSGTREMESTDVTGISCTTSSAGDAAAANHQPLAGGQSASEAAAEAAAPDESDHCANETNEIGPREQRRQRPTKLIDAINAHGGEICRHSSSSSSSASEPKATLAASRAAEAAANLGQICDDGDDVTCERRTGCSRDDGNERDTNEAGEHDAAEAGQEMSDVSLSSRSSSRSGGGNSTATDDGGGEHDGEDDDGCAEEEEEEEEDEHSDDNMLFGSSSPLSDDDDDNNNNKADGQLDGRATKTTSRPRQRLASFEGAAIERGGGGGGGDSSHIGRGLAETGSSFVNVIMNGLSGLQAAAPGQFEMRLAAAAAAANHERRRNSSTSVAAAAAAAAMAPLPSKSKQAAGLVDCKTSVIKNCASMRTLTTTKSGATTCSAGGSCKQVDDNNV